MLMDFQEYLLGAHTIISIEKSCIFKGTFDIFKDFEVPLEIVQNILKNISDIYYELFSRIIF